MSSTARFTLDEAGELLDLIRAATAAATRYGEAIVDDDATEAAAKAASKAASEAVLWRVLSLAVGHHVIGNLSGNN